MGNSSIGKLRITTSCEPARNLGRQKVELGEATPSRLRSMLALRADHFIDLHCGFGQLISGLFYNQTQLHNALCVCGYHTAPTKTSAAAAAVHSDTHDWPKAFPRLLKT
jgi:predicted deacylase